MRSVLSISGIFYVLKSSIILSLGYTHHSTVDKIIAFNLCTGNHCEDCSGGEVLECSNGAIFDRYGDLCGCCQSCVRFQDLGESCGSQLAVRSAENLRVSRPRVTILATTRCKKTLICENFTCKRFNETVDRQIINEESFELWLKLITTENLVELYNEHRSLAAGLSDVENHRDDVDFMIQGNEQPRESSLPIESSRKTTILSQENEIFRGETELGVESRKIAIFEPSDHLINLLVGSRELQLIYGHKALEDFNSLIESIGKSVTNSILKKYEIEGLYERFHEIVHFTGANKETQKIEKHTSSWTSFNDKNPSNKSKGGAAAITVQPDFASRVHSSEIPNSEASLRKIRAKRELENVEKFADTKVKDRIQENRKEVNEESNNQYPGISVYDVINKTPRLEDFEDWLSIRTVERNSRGKPLDSDETESEINIHITGLPGVTNLSLDTLRIGEKNNEDIRIDSVLDKRHDEDDVLVSNANSAVTITENRIKNSTNFAASNISQDQVNHESTENVGEKLQFSNNHFEFTFPEYPVILENKRDADSAANETANEFRAQLDRIETRTIFIENAVHAIMKKIDTNRSYKDIDQREMADTRMVERHQKNPFSGDDTMFRQRTTANSKNENPINIRVFSNRNENLSIGNTRLEEFIPKRSSRLDLRDVPKISRNRRRRPHRNKESHETESDWEKQKKSMADSRKVLERRKLPMLLSNSERISPNLHERQRKDSRLVQREQFDLEVGSNSPEERVHPFNFFRPLPVVRTNRRIEQNIRANGRSPQMDNPVVEQSAIFLETQIPRSRTTVPSNIGDPLGGRSIRLIAKYEDDEDWNSRANTYTNLFAVQEGNSEFGSPAIFSMERSGTNENDQEIVDVDESYWLLPGNLDYAERINPKVEKIKIVESELDKSLPNFGQKEAINSSLDRTKRDASDKFSLKQKLNVNKQIRSKILALKCDDESSEKNTSRDLKSSKTIANNPNFSTNGSSNVNADMKRPPRRSKRSVQMADWLRAAQEYHDHLRELRAAALKTWLASREIITDTNLTNVKLFTREIPSRLEAYQVTSFEENFDDIADVMIDDYPVEDATADSSEILTGILVDQSSPNENYSLSKQADDRNDEQRLIQLSSLSGPRKLIITTNGNSTIRIEELANRDYDATRLEDQLTQDSTADQVSHEIPITTSDNDYFDHMYESFDTDDGDFNYEVSRSMLGWHNAYDKIDSSNKKDPSNDRSRESSHVKAQIGSSGRYKRNSPLVLFKADDDPNKNILIWPSNWRDLIDRHLRLNRTDNNLIKKRRAYRRPRKIVSVPVAAKFETGTKINQQKNEQSFFT